MFKPVEWFLGRFSADMGIDLGTANTLVYVKDQGIVLNEPSVVAVRAGTHEVLLDGMAVGDVAKEMLGKVPGNIEAVRPMRNGVISDFEVTEKMLRYFITKVHGGRQWVKPKVVISVPAGITAVERRAVISSAERAGAYRVYLIEEPLAAGIGVGLPVTKPHGSMIVDIGGGTTEVAVLSLAGTVAWDSIRVAGDSMDESIISYMRRQHNLHIGPLRAERLKMNLGSAVPMEEELTVMVKGRDALNGLPRRVEVSSTEIREGALIEPVRKIAQAIHGTLEQTPPELSGDLVDQGITLCGGGSMLRGIGSFFENETGIPCALAEEPLTAVARGTGVYVEDIATFSKVLQSNMDDD